MTEFNDWIYLHEPPRAVLDAMFSFPKAKLEFGNLARELVDRGIDNFPDAVQWVWRLPYGRISDPKNLELTVSERRGTCSTKHAFIASLAQAHGIEMKLCLGIFMMSKENTPVLSELLDSCELPAIPEAHCYLLYNGEKFDFTFTHVFDPHPHHVFLFETTINPGDVSTKKTSIHQRWIKSWLANQSDSAKSFEEVWKIRERCIQLLENPSV